MRPIYRATLAAALTSGAAGFMLLPASAIQNQPLPACEPLPTKITTALATPTPNFPGAPIQCNYDLYSWLNFIALNWPADPAKCEADTSVSILSGKGPVVWETYLADADVFRSGGKPPLSWCPKEPSDLPESVPAEMAAASRKPGGPRVFSSYSKASVKFKEKFPDIAPAVGSAVVDQNGRFVRYEVHINQDEYNYLKAPNGNPQANLYSIAGQKAFNADANMPAGKTPYGPVGATEIKASWKVMGAGDDPKRFYTISGQVCTNQQDPEKNWKWSTVTLGLVGLHISRNIPTQPNWLWSTFEHVSNCPTEGTTPAARAYSFNDPKCLTGMCPANVPLANQQNELGPDGKPLNLPTQVVRVNPISPDTDKMNKAFQKLLAGSVWENYQLVGTQVGGPDPGFDVQPGWMSNSTIETFNQGPKPPTDGPLNGNWWNPQSGYQPFSTAVSSSCLKCHNLAQQITNKNADFSFLLGTAE